MDKHLAHNPYVDSTYWQPKAQRTTKFNQKLVLFPADENDQTATLMGEARSAAERTVKEERYLFPRVTCYCAASAHDIDSIQGYLESIHNIRPKKYDECLYICYESHYDDDHPSYQRLLAQPISEDNMYTSLNPSEIPLWMMRKEIFVFDYGVIVFWNFLESEERRFLNIFRKFSTKSLSDNVMEVEDLNFQYDLSEPFQPRIFNDMITLKSGNPLIKLTISHALAQSVKLSFFENIMEKTIEGAAPLPKMMAKYGKVNMTRTQVMKIVGQLFQLRVDVNLISNVLDTPEIFWSEIELEPLYMALRRYLEISQRVHLLNGRARVVSDLLDMLSEHMNSTQMTWITWIIIWLIAVAAIVAALEVWVKYLRLQSGNSD